MKSEARFDLTGQLVRRPNVGTGRKGDYGFLTVRVDRIYHDVAVFEDGPLEEVSRLDGNEEIKLKGDIRKKKNQKTGAFETSLVATWLQVLDHPPQRPARHPAQADDNDQGHWEERR